MLFTWLRFALWIPFMWPKYPVTNRSGDSQPQLQQLTSSASFCIWKCWEALILLGFDFSILGLSKNALQTNFFISDISNSYSENRWILSFLCCCCFFISVEKFIIWNGFHTLELKVELRTEYEQKISRVREICSTKDVA